VAIVKKNRRHRRWRYIFNRIGGPGYYLEQHADGTWSVSLGDQHLGDFGDQAAAEDFVRRATGGDKQK
jgi:hypothetical protein